METNVIYNEECLQGMRKRIPDNSIDMILADLPYGTTACKWDSIIPLEPLWEQYKRIVKDDTAIVLTASQPFTTKLIQSNMDWFKYEWIWKKSNPSNIALADKQPMKYHENIPVFCNTSPKYNKQMIKRDSPRVKQGQDNNYIFHNDGSEQTGLGEIEKNASEYDAGYKNPSTVIEVNSLRPNSKEFVEHPTQKPVELFKYLIKTYTNKGDIVLDNVIGSGTTAVAAKALDRKYIGFEQDEEYYGIAVKRTREVQKELITQ